jgi:hypothetical protein
MTNPTIYWVARSRNTKTGDIPQGYIGATREDTEQSCTGCGIRKKCYYWHGATQMAHASIRRTALKGKDYSLPTALRYSLRSANYARAAIGGDPSIFTKEEVRLWHDQVQAAGLRGLIIYTHFPDGKGKHLKGLSLASTESLEHADALVASGWKTAITLPVRAPHSSRHKELPEYKGQKFTTPQGRKIPICPAQIKRGVTCNNCGWCATSLTFPQKPTPLLIGFLTQ